MRTKTCLPLVAAVLGVLTTDVKAQVRPEYDRGAGALNASTAAIADNGKRATHRGAPG